MDSINQQPSKERLFDIIGTIRERGVRLWSESGRLRYRAPRGALSADDLEELRIHSSQIITLLEHAPDTHPQMGNGEHVRLLNTAPLTFSQLNHWYGVQTGEWHSTRHLAHATRLQGPLNVAALRRSIEEIVARQEALRTRIVVVNGSPVQEICAPCGYQLIVDDLTALSLGARERAVQRILNKTAFEPIDLARDALFEARLLRIGHSESILLLAMEHMISDAFSLGILVRDVFDAYSQAVNGDDICLPPVSLRYSDYAVLQNSRQKAWVEMHGRYWQERLAGGARLQGVDEAATSRPSVRGWQAIPLTIGAPMKSALNEWRQSRRTTLALTVYAAYVALLFRWYAVTDVVVRYQIDGRNDESIVNTIGYFASKLHLRVELLERDTIMDLLFRVTSEYCAAHQHADSSYLEAQLPRPPYVSAPSFNWVPQNPRPAPLTANGDADSLTVSLVSLGGAELGDVTLDCEPMLLLFDRDDVIDGRIYFPNSRFTEATTSRFRRNFLSILERLLLSPNQRVGDISLLD